MYRNRLNASASGDPMNISCDRLSLSDRGIELYIGKRIRNWGGWYRHDVVTLNGKPIGRIQVKRNNGRTEALTLSDIHPGCVLGSNIDWLISQAS